MSSWGCLRFCWNYVVLDDVSEKKMRPLKCRIWFPTRNRRLLVCLCWRSPGDSHLCIFANTAIQAGSTNQPRFHGHHFQKELVGQFCCPHRAPPCMDFGKKFCTPWQNLHWKLLKITYYWKGTSFWTKNLHFGRSMVIFRGVFHVLTSNRSNRKSPTSLRLWPLTTDCHVHWPVESEFADESPIFKTKTTLKYPYVLCGCFQK